jgi:membrane-bound transcription factor site-1 protease
MLVFAFPTYFYENNNNFVHFFYAPPALPRRWSPYTGGANVPALNDLLAPFGIALGDQVLTGTVSLAGAAFKYLSGAQLARFPAGGYVHHAPMSDRASSAATVGALSLAARSSRMYHPALP